MNITEALHEKDAQRNINQKQKSIKYLLVVGDGYTWFECCVAFRIVVGNITVLFNTLIQSSKK